MIFLYLLRNCPGIKSLWSPYILNGLAASEHALFAQKGSAANRKRKFWPWGSAILDLGRRSVAGYDPRHCVCLETGLTFQLLANSTARGRAKGILEWQSKWKSRLSYLMYGKQQVLIKQRPRSRDDGFEWNVPVNGEDSFQRFPAILNRELDISRARRRGNSSTCT